MNIFINKMKNETNKKMCDFHNTTMEKKNVDFDFKFTFFKIHLKFITTTGSVPLKRVNKSMNRSINLGNPLHVLCTLKSNHQVLC